MTTNTTGNAPRRTIAASVLETVVTSLVAMARAPLTGHDGTTTQEGMKRHGAKMMLAIADALGEAPGDDLLDDLLSRVLRELGDGYQTRFGGDALASQIATPLFLSSLRTVGDQMAAGRILPRLERHLVERSCASQRGSAIKILFTLGYRFPVAAIDLVHEILIDGDEQTVSRLFSCLSPEETPTLDDAPRDLIVAMANEGCANVELFLAALARSPSGKIALSEALIYVACARDVNGAARLLAHGARLSLVPGVSSIPPIAEIEDVMNHMPSLEHYEIHYEDDDPTNDDHADRLGQKEMMALVDATRSAHGAVTARAAAIRHLMAAGTPHPS